MTAFAHPPFPHRWFDDFALGQVFDYGRVVVTAEKILEFAREYDPEPFHTDAAKAAPLFGGLIASGVQVAAWWRRMNFDAFAGIGADATSVASPGWDEIRWKKPVKPGDILSCRSTVNDLRLLKSRPGIGHVRFANAMRNQDGDIRMTHFASVFLKRRPA
jgi:acyl dehydratase